MGWGGPDCSIPVPVTTSGPTLMPPSANTTLSMKRNEVIYGKAFHVPNLIYII